MRRIISLLETDCEKVIKMNDIELVGKLRKEFKFVAVKSIMITVFSEKSVERLKELLKEYNAEAKIDVTEVGHLLLLEIRLF